MIVAPNPQQTVIRVADFGISLAVSNSTVALLLEDGYESFITPDSDDVDMRIMAYPFIPEVLVSEGDKLLYRATRDGQAFWTIYRHERGYKLVTYSQTDVGRLQQIALIDADFKNWEIFAVPIGNPETNGFGICPLEYPMGPLLFYYLTVRHEAIMIHASGVSESGTGRIFSGFSGVGKSTMAKLWEKEGSLLINDDRLIIRQRGDDFYIHNTPMPYRDIPKVSRLDAIYLPYHAPANKMEPLSLLKAVSKVMAYCIIHGYNKEHLEHHLAFLTRLCSKLPVSLLGVVPDRQVIPFIKAGETKDTVDQP